MAKKDRVPVGKEGLTYVWKSEYPKYLALDLSARTENEAKVRLAPSKQESFDCFFFLLLDIAHTSKGIVRNASKVGAGQWIDGCIYECGWPLVCQG